MNDLQTWKFIADALLLMSLGYLCMRFMRSGPSAVDERRAAELERTLRTLIHDAESEGRTLNSELLKRQEDLRKLLYDIETVETRANRTISSSEEQKQALAREISKAEEAKRQFEERGTKAAIAPAIEPQIPVVNQSSYSEDRKDWTTTNIFGEPISAGTEPPTTLTRAIEQEATPTSGVAQSSIEDLYFAAEELLKAGHELNYVAARTSLPLDEVDLLARTLRRRPAQAAEDPRLGVLGGMRRQVQVL